MFRHRLDPELGFLKNVPAAPNQPQSKALWFRSEINKKPRLPATTQNGKNTQHLAKSLVQHFLRGKTFIFAQLATCFKSQTRGIERKTSRKILCKMVGCFCHARSTYKIFDQAYQEKINLGDDGEKISPQIISKRIKEEILVLVHWIFVRGALL